jgi:flagella basal body P-ring formation protein FlgA
MTSMRKLMLAAALLLPATAAGAQNASERGDIPVLRAAVTVSGDVVRVGDLIENAGSAAPIALYRAPDPGTSGNVPVASVLAALRAHQIIGVDARGLREISVTRNGRTLAAGEIETAIAGALAQRMSVSEPSALALAFDRDIAPVQLDVTYSGDPKAIAVTNDSRGRFDVTLEIAGDRSTATVRLRYTGTATETAEAAVVLRTVERGEMLKASDIRIERRPRSEVASDALLQKSAVGMQARRQLRGNSVLRAADLAKADLVTRDQSVTLIYEAAGIYLTVQGKALENGTEGDVVSVINLSSKRTVTGAVSARNQVTIAAGPIRPAPAQLSAVQPKLPVAVASAAPAIRPAE